MLVLSHRGYHKNVPENTLEAFEQAVALGVDGIETDVRLSADGMPVLFHDRLAPDGRTVASLTRSQLSAAAGYTVPTLDVALARWKEVLWNVEIKTPAALDATIPILGRYQNSTRLLVSSFWHNVVLAVRQALDVPCGLLVAHRPANISQLLSPTAADSGHDIASSYRPVDAIVWHFEILDREMLKTAGALGAQNFAWGMVTPEEHRSCAAMGLDGIITDHPDLLLRPSSDAMK